MSTVTVEHRGSDHVDPRKFSPMNTPMEDIAAEMREVARMASGIPTTAHILARRLVEYADAIEADLKSRGAGRDG
jgi:hypothetical protein